MFRAETPGGKGRDAMPDCRDLRPVPLRQRAGGAAPARSLARPHPGHGAVRGGGRPNPSASPIGA